MKATFGRVMTAMVTPFAQDGSLDRGAVANLASWLVDEQQMEGLVLAGTTGESPTLTHQEQGELFGAVREVVDVPLIAGTGSNNTSEAIDLTKRAIDAGMDGLLVVTPYYNRPSQAGMLEHFTTVAGAGEGLPLLVYDIPVRTGRKVAHETLVELISGVDNIIGVKDAAGDPAATASLIAEVPGAEIYSGDDSLTLPLLSVGAVGAIGVATHWTGPEHVAMFDALERGDLKTARGINAMMLESFAFESSNDAPNPIPTKALLRAIGLPVGFPRPPMTGTPEGLEGAALDLLRGSGFKVEKMLGALR